MSLGTTSNTCQIVYLLLLMIIISASNNSTQTVNCASPVYVWALECPQSHPRPTTKAPILIGWSGTADQRPLSFFVAEFGPTCLATHDKWFLTFSKISTESLIYSSQCSTNWHFPLESLQGWDIGFKSSKRSMLSPSPIQECTAYRKSTKKIIFAKDPRVLLKWVPNNHPTTGSRFKALTKQIRSAAQLWQCCFQTVNELSAVTNDFDNTNFNICKQSTTFEWTSSSARITSIKSSKQQFIVSELISY